MHSRPDLLRHRLAEHVQNLVSLVSGLEQAARCLPDLGRGVLPKLRRHDLVHREVQARVHWATAQIHCSPAAPECLLELRMLASDNQRADIGIAEVIKAEAQLRQDGRISDEALPIQRGRLPSHAAYCRALAGRSPEHETAVAPNGLLRGHGLIRPQPVRTRSYNVSGARSAPPGHTTVPVSPSTAASADPARSR